MYSILLITINILVISSVILAETSEEYIDSIENHLGDIRESICDDPEKIYSRIISECFYETNLYKFKRAFKECYRGIEVVNGKNLYNWYCSHSEESSQLADKCAEEKINQQSGKDAFSELSYAVMNCTISKFDSEDHFKN